jgi:FkbM family methyltransferase
MNALRLSLLRFCLWLLRALSTDKADEVDLYFCYRLLLRREPDKPGWRDQLRFIKPGRSRRLLVETFMNSPEYRSLHELNAVACVDTGRFTMWLDKEDALIAEGILADRTYEPHVTAILERELTPESTFVDIGANMGWFTLLGASIARRVIAIEPNHNNVQLIYHSLLANSFTNVQVLEYAVTDEPRLLQLNFLRSNGSVAAIDEALEATTIVRGDSLDNLLSDVDHVDVMKMDIEGHEPIALRGMGKILTRFRPVLLAEFHPMAIRANSGGEPAEFLKSLSGYGYDLAVIRHDGAETAPLDVAGILDEWENLNREMDAQGFIHLDIICRPR